ncbi:MAG: hypothetical protein K6F32_07655 [Bacilli bacterium]|nr:hypothetical protein [Bacilli bacterium]
MRVLLYLFFIISVVIGAFLNESIAFFNEPNNLWMNDPEFFLTLAAAVFSSLTFIFLSHRYGGAKVKPFLLILFLMLFVGDVIAILAFPETKVGVITRFTGEQQGYVFSITNTERIRELCMFGMSCVYFYMVFALLPQILRGKHALNFVFYATVFVTAFVIVWSIVNEQEIYKKYLDIHAEITTNDFVSSCFNNRNTYGTILLLGICCLGYLQCESRHFWNYILMGIFFLANLITLSKTSIIASIIFVSAFLVYRFFQTFKYHKVKDILGVLLIAAMLVFLTIARGSDNEGLRNNIFTKLYGNFLEALSRRVEGTFLEDRTEIWIGAYDMLDTQIAKIFGLGEVNIYFLLGNAWAKFSDPVPLYWAHNGIAHSLAAGGFFRIAIYGITIIVFLTKDIKTIMKGSSTGMVSLLFFLTFMIHGMTETTGFLMPDTKGLTLLVMVYVPVFAEYEHPDTVDLAEAFRGQFKQKYVVSPASKATLWSALAGLWLVYALGVAPVLFKLDIPCWHSNVYMPLGVIYLLTMPIYFFLSYSCKSKFGGFLGRFIYLLVFVSSFVVSTIYDNPSILMVPGFVIPVALAFLGASNMKDLSRGNWWKLWRFYLVHILVIAYQVGLNHLAYFMLTNSEYVEITTTMCVVFVIANATHLIFLIVATPLSNIYIYPFDLMGVQLDEKIGIMMRKYEEKVAERNARYLRPHKKKKTQNNWLPQN